MLMLAEACRCCESLEHPDAVVLLMARDWVGMMITCDNILCTWLGNTRDSHFFVHAQNLSKFTRFSNTLFLSTFCVLALEQRRFHTKHHQTIYVTGLWAFFPTCFFFQQLQASGAPKWVSTRRCSGDLSCWRTQLDQTYQFREVHCTSLPFLNFSEVQIFNKLYLQQSAQVSHTIYIPLPRPVEYFRSLN